jgi:hypothetical protein
MMKPVGLLSVLFFVATAANAVSASMSEVSSSRQPAVLLAAAGGQDSVGGLMPLPLWPPYSPRTHAPAPRESKHKVRKCTACPH